MVSQTFRIFDDLDNFEEIAQGFCRMFSAGVCLVFFLWLDLVVGLGGRPQRGGARLMPSYQGCRPSPGLITAGVDLDHWLRSCLPGSAPSPPP